MHTKTLPALLLSIIASVPIAASAGPATDAKSRADAVVAKYAKPGHPGCAVGVYQDGNTLYEGASGLANLEHSVPIDPKLTVFDVGSVSKQFTAASILLLVQDGKLKLDDDIRKYLPEMPDYGHVITIDHMLHNTSGLRDFQTVHWMMGRSWWNYVTEQETFDIITSQKALNFNPGAKYVYSNTGYILASMIVHRVSGKSLASFAQERIFAPLGMTNTYFQETLGRVTPHHASGYALAKNGTFEARSDRSMSYGASKLQSTIPDLAKWQRNFDDPKVGGAWLIEQLERNGTLNDGTKIEYARGLEVYGEGAGYRALRTVDHSGGTWDGYRSDVMRLTKDKTSIAVLCNSDDGKPVRLRNDVIDIFMEGKFPNQPQQAATAQEPEPKASGTLSLSDLPANFVGLYWNREDIKIRRIELIDGRLWYVRGPESRTELVPVGNGQFRMIGVPTKVVVELLPSKTGPQIIRVGTTAILEKVEPFSADALPEYAGTYVSSELGNARAIFTIKDGKLTVAPHEGVEALNPVFKDAFLDGDEEVFVMFQRNASGRITSLMLETVRARNIVFTRAPEVRGR